MSDLLRPVAHRFEARPTLEGAGVRLRRAFSNGEVPLFDPFLLLDNFGSSNPEDYLAGFPWHPHRGIETVTYMLEGRVDHADTLGNAGMIGPGDVQWMTAGSGIIHQEMPRRAEGRMAGFQLWVNLAAKEKMAEPAYRGLDQGTIPSVETDAGAKVRVVAGEFQGVRGAVRGLSVDPTYLDVALPPQSAFELSLPSAYTAFAHSIGGAATFGDASPAREGETLLFAPGDRVRVTSGEAAARFLLVAGRPLHEPVSWYGPIVMNTREEIVTAARELRDGDFLKHRSARTDS